MATQVKKDESEAQPQMPGGASPPAAKLPAMQAQVKDVLLSALTSAAEKMVALASALKEAPTTDQPADPPVPESVVAQLGELGSMITGLQNQYASGAGGDKTAAAKAPPTAPGEQVEPAKAGGLPGVSDNGAQDQQGELKFATAVGKLRAAKGADVVLKSAEVGILLLGMQKMAAGSLPVAKVGRKMAKERLERFRKAMDILASVMKELMNDAGRARKSATDAAPAGVKTGVVTMKAADATSLVEHLDALTSLVAKQGAELTASRAEALALRRGAQPSNSLPNEGRAPAGKVTWPLDMNKDITPSGPARSFGSGR